MNQFWRYLLLALFSMAIIPCVESRGADESTGAAPTEPVRLQVAASMKDVIKELADFFAKDTGVTFQINAGPSSALAAQIIAGAPADIFISSHPLQMEQVKAKGLTAQITPWAGNTLVIITQVKHPAKVQLPEDLALPAVQKIALAGEKVPAGMYAKEALEALKIYDSLEKAGKIVRGKDVRSALLYVERGEAEAGIVYATDARLSDKVKVAYTFPADTHEPIVYPLALLMESANKKPARQFYEFLQTPPAHEILKKHGFNILQPEKPKSPERE